MALTKVTNSMIAGAVVNVQDFGAVGDGVADDSGAIQAAIDSLSSNGGTVYFPPGDYVIANTIIASSANVVFDLNKQYLAFKSTYQPIDPITNIPITGSEYELYPVMFAVTADNCTFINGNFHQGNYGLSTQFIWGNNNNISNLRVLNCDFYDCLYVAGQQGVAVIGRPNCSGMVVDNCYFENCKAAVVVQGSNATISNCQSINTTSNGGTDSMYSIDSGNNDSVINCLCTKDANAAQAGNVIEIGATTNYLVQGNIVVGLTGGVGIENVIIGLSGTGSNGIITDNIIDGGGLTAVGALAFIKVSQCNSIEIKNNLLRNPPINAPAVNGQGIVTTGSNITVRANRVFLGANDRFSSAIEVGQGTNSGPLFIEDNQVVTYGLGLDVGGTDNGGYIVQIKNNTLTNMQTAIRSTFTGRNTKIYLENNTFEPDLLNPGVNVFPYTRSFAQGAGAYPHRINKRKVWYGPEEPTVTYYDNSSWEIGDTVYNLYPAVGSPIGWKCTVTGTFTAAATTGGITSGTTSLVVASATGFEVGDYITIAGVTGTKQIRVIVGTTFTIDSNADATVAAAAVVTPVPVFTAMANL
jgi:hypothetical protein